jgi:hypothetical protein
MVNFWKKLLKPILALGAMTIASFSCNSTTPNARNSPTRLSETLQAQPTSTTESTKLTVGDIRELKEPGCNGLGNTLVYAETKNYLVYICGDEQNRKPEAFRIKLRNWQIGYLEGKSQFSWNKDSFVGMTNDISFKLSKPSELLPYYYSGRETEFLINISLNGKNFKPIFLREIAMRFLISQYLLTKDDSIPNNHRELTARIVPYLVEKNKGFYEQCRGFELRDSVKASRIFAVNSEEYLLAQYCSSNTKNPIYIYWSITLKGNTIESIPILLRRYPLNLSLNERLEYQVDGEPDYNSHLEILSIYRSFLACGELIRYKVNKSDLQVKEMRSWSEGSCNALSHRPYTDPVLFPQDYP